jgi:hypothetical protein
MKSNLIARLALSILIISINLSVVSFIGDMVINFTNALKRINFLGLYIIDFLIFHSWIFAICVIVYYYLFNIIKLKNDLILKCLFALLVGYCLSRVLYNDEASMSTYYKSLKITISYCLTGIISVLLLELYFIPVWFKKRYNI